MGCGFVFGTKRGLKMETKVHVSTKSPTSVENGGGGDRGGEAFEVGRKRQGAELCRGESNIDEGSSEDKFV